MIETFSEDQEPTVLAVGSSPRKRLPLRKFLRTGRDVDEVRALLARIVQSRQAVRTITPDGRRQLIGEPLCAYDGRAFDDERGLFDGRVYGAFVWLGPVEEAPPVHNPAGAWTINLTRGLSARSDDLLDLYHVERGGRKHVHSISELFAQQLHPGNDEASAIAKLVRARPQVDPDSKE
ncbi:GAF domain-containing protein [Kibdelosporangium lantanae]|uniref:GAF domain-containing protein n=1 Tax=Kibdelosporangium lantanae TaxID=1497396 RepID=A0ABW3M5W7_9PSEU